MTRTRDRISGIWGGSTENRPPRRGWGRALPLIPLLVSGVLLTACSDDSSEGGGKAAASPTGERDRGVAFAKCMRENGVAKFPDPGDDGHVFAGKDSGVDPESAEFKKASEACKDLAPQGKAEPNDGTPVDPVAAREWAKCVRENGVPNFPDPKFEGTKAEVDTTGIDSNEAGAMALDKAMEACRDKRPAGSIRFRQNGAGQ